MSSLWQAELEAAIAQAHASAGISAPTIPPASVVSSDPDFVIADQAISWLAPNLPGGKTNSIYTSWRAQIMSAVKAGRLDPGGQYDTQTGKCSGATSPGPNDVQLAGQAIGAAGSAASAGATIAGATSVIPIIGIATLGGSLLIKLFSKLFGPPTSALEQKYLCPLVASANQVLKQIAAELSAGYITAAQASTAFDSMQASFDNQLVTNVHECNCQLLYYNTPNDSQFMQSSLGAIGVKLKGSVYGQLEATASANKSLAASASAAALSAQISQDVQLALGSNSPVSAPSTNVWELAALAAAVIIIILLIAQGGA